MEVKEIQKLLTKRDGLLSTDMKEADKIEAQITQVFKKKFDDYPVDFIIGNIILIHNQSNLNK